MEPTAVKLSTNGTLNEDTVILRKALVDSLQKPIILKKVPIKIVSQDTKLSEVFEAIKPLNSTKSIVLKPRSPTPFPSRI